MRYTPEVVVMSAHAMDRVESWLVTETERFNANPELMAISKEKGWDPRMVLLGFLFEELLENVTLPASLA